VDDKKKMRTFLATVVGDVSNDELTGEYDDLFAVLAQQPNVDLDIIEKQYRSLVQNTKKRKDEIPALIESEQYRISSYDQTYDFVAIQNGIDSETATIQQCDNQLIGKKEALQPYIDAQMKAVEERTRRQQALDNARTTHDQQNAQMRQQYVDAIVKAQKANASVDENNRRKQQELDFKKHQLESAQRDLELCQQKRLKLKEEQAQVKARVFTEDKCAYCGQTLPEEAQEAARQRFNEKKEADNRAIVVKGRANNEDIALYQKRIEELSADIAKGIVLDEVQDLTTLKAQLDEFDRNMTLFEDTETFDILFQQVNAVVIPQIPNQDTDTIVQMKNEAMERLKNLNQQMGVRAIRQKCVETVESLKAEQQELEATAAGYEKILIQLKHYRQEKMEVISRRVNEHLEYASIQMFSVQKDGTIVPDLIIKDKDGISYSTTNGASRILMAVDMQRFFCEKNGIQMPVWIDEASIINPVRLAYLNGQQVIKLMFADCPLTVEKY
jgi:DNA repair exonuclease SbcCD ATPase subunit